MIIPETFAEGERRVTAIGEGRPGVIHLGSNTTGNPAAGLETAEFDARVEAMLAAGVREEVMRAHAAGASETARRALGYEELLDGDVERMKRRTRNYARRQLTWMRKLAGVHLLDLSGRDPVAVAHEILDFGAL